MPIYTDIYLYTDDIIKAITPFLGVHGPFKTSFLNLKIE